MMNERLEQWSDLTSNQTRADTHDHHCPPNPRAIGTTPATPENPEIDILAKSLAAASILGVDKRLLGWGNMAGTRVSSSR